MLFRGKCEQIFATQAETEAHWLEVHTASALPDTDAGPEVYSHSYRSCSINIPIVCAGGDSGARSRRVGSIRVSAYLEDVGLVRDTTEATMGSRYAIHLDILARLEGLMTKLVYEL